MLSRISSKLFHDLIRLPFYPVPVPVRPSQNLRSFYARSGYFPPYGTYTYLMTLSPYTEDMLDVKVVDGEIVVKGKIEESVGEDRWTYEFVKRHTLPKDVDLNTVTTRFENGELVVKAKLKESAFK